MSQPESLEGHELHRSRKDWKAQALRLHADMADFKQRQKRLTEQAVAAEHDRLMRLFLPVLDDLDRALTAEEPVDLKLWKGVALVRRELLRALAREGLRRMETLNKPFDPRLHEAVSTRKAAGTPGTVVEEVVAGYMLGDNLLRAARVVVAE